MPQTTDPRAYLETPARIIAENDTHAVIALRLPKLLVAESLPFLSALIDCAVKAGSETEAPETPAASV